MSHGEPAPVTTCRTCRARIEFHASPVSGKPTPFVRVRTLYRLEESGALRKVERPPGARPLLVSHFETCPDARQFSERSRERGGAEHGDQ